MTIAIRGVLALVLAGAHVSPALGSPADPIPPVEGRVVLVSYDGLGRQLLETDPASRELTVLHRIAAAGFSSDGLISSFPSNTGNGHAVLYNGVHSHENGITIGNMQVPRSEHSILETISGFHASLLRSEPIWLTAAKQGVPSLVIQGTQNYPFLPNVTGVGLDVPPVLVSGYGPAMLSDHTVVDKGSVTFHEEADWSGYSIEPAGRARYLSWTAGAWTFLGVLAAAPGGPFTSLQVAVSPAGPWVRADAHPEETTSSRGRKLGRYFSPGLVLTDDEGSAISVAYFRLFELAPDGSSFTLFHPATHGVGLYDGSGEERKIVDRLLREAGGFIGNGNSFLYRDGLLGAQIYEGGDGRAERRYLESIELVVRQYNAFSRWLTERYRPQLLLDYSNYPDEVDHWWYGLGHHEITGVDPAMSVTFNDLRAESYATLDIRSTLLDSLAGPSGYVMFTSDHGMAAAHRRVYVNAILEQGGLLRYDDQGNVDLGATQAYHHLASASIVINTVDWKDGIVRLEDRDRVRDEARALLEAVTDPDTGEPVFVQFFLAEEHQDTLGTGGENGADLYFDVAVGYGYSAARSDDIVVEMPVPRGTHSFLPTRPDMLSAFVGRGPGIEAGTRLPIVHGVDVAPLVCDLLGIERVAAYAGRNPLTGR